MFICILFDVEIKKKNMLLVYIVYVVGKNCFENDKEIFFFLNWFLKLIYVLVVEMLKYWLYLIEVILLNLYKEMFFLKVF